MEKLIDERIVKLDDLKEYASFIASTLNEGDIVILEGPLGAGKTTLVREIADFYEVDEVVSSPTFTLVNEYAARIKGKESIMRHIDVYRLEDAFELSDIGLSEMIAEGGIIFVEWGNKFLDFFPKKSKTLKIERIDEETRKFTLSSNN